MIWLPSMKLVPTARTGGDEAVMGENDAAASRLLAERPAQRKAHFCGGHGVCGGHRVDAH